MQDMGGIPFWLVLVIIVFGVAIFVLMFIMKKNKKQPFKKLDLEKETKDNYKTILTLMGTKKQKKKLMWGFEDKGYIGRTALKANGVRIIELYKNILFWLLNVKASYLSIPEDAITQNIKEINIDSDYRYDNQSGVMVFGKKGQAEVDEVAYKLTHQQTLNEMVNWLPLQSYLSVQHTQSSETLDHIAEIAKENKEDAIHKMTGKTK